MNQGSDASVEEPVIDEPMSIEDIARALDAEIITSWPRGR